MATHSRAVRAFGFICLTNADQLVRTVARGKVACETRVLSVTSALSGYWYQGWCSDMCAGLEIKLDPKLELSRQDARHHQHVAE
eukprot:SAG11_NODE_15783_length_566_cov_1.760171_1_plen_84_part_00